MGTTLFFNEKNVDRFVELFKNLHKKRKVVRGTKTFITFISYGSSKNKKECVVFKKTNWGKVVIRHCYITGVVKRVAPWKSNIVLKQRCNKFKPRALHINSKNNFQLSSGKPVDRDVKKSNLYQELAKKYSTNFSPYLTCRFPMLPESFEEIQQSV